MKYLSANDILPDSLIREIQQYVQGSMLYIPSPVGKRKKWGQSSGQREYLKRRNSEIRQRFRSGESADRLADSYGLSVERIKRIVYQKY